MYMSDGRPSCKDLCSSIAPPTCAPNQFQCKSGETLCVHIAWKCDGDTECSDGSDEEDCPPCLKGQFRCKTNKKCVENKNQCPTPPPCTTDSCPNPGKHALQSKRYKFS